MCSAPGKLPNGVVVSCRKCKSCKDNRYRSWVGRLLAEEQSSQGAWFITLTYGGGDHEKAYVLDYADIKRMFKRMRKAGHEFRYVITGEYGTLRDRAHWHALIYWITPPPAVPMDERFEWEFWPYKDRRGNPTGYGFTQVERPRSTQASAAYVMKYLDKDDASLEGMRFSKVPALGSAYLKQYAERHADEGLALWRDGPRYTIPGNQNRDGKLFWYTVRPSTPVYDRMIRAYLERWAVQHFARKIPFSETVYDWIEEGINSRFVELSDIARAYLMKHFDHFEPMDLDETVTFEQWFEAGAVLSKQTWHGHGLPIARLQTTLTTGRTIEVWQNHRNEAEAVEELLVIRRRLEQRAAARTLARRRKNPIVGVNCSSVQRQRLATQNGHVGVTAKAMLAQLPPGTKHVSDPPL